MFLWTWIRRASHPGNGQNRKDAARLLGVAVAPLRVCAFPSGKGWYHGMEPRYLLMLKTLYLLWCDVGYRALGWKGPKGPGNGVLVSVVTQLGVTRPCVGRVPVWFSGMSFQRHSHVAMGSSLAWPFVGNPIPNTKPCTVLVVEPAIYLWWSPLFRW